MRGVVSIMPKQKFGAFLKIQLEGQTQASLARATGVMETSISRWIAGTSNPSFESCLRVARYFNLPPTRILAMLPIRKAEKYIELYSWFLADYEPKDISLEFVYQDAEIRGIHETLDEMIAASSGEKTDMDIPSLVSGLLIGISELTKT